LKKAANHGGHDGHGKKTKVKEIPVMPARAGIQDDDRETEVTRCLSPCPSWYEVSLDGSGAR
jgi:hypothetical protein